MAGDKGTRIDPESPIYREVARLYRIAHEIRPGGQDRWNGELFSRNDGLHGGLSNDGTLRLSDDLVLKHLTGGERGDDLAQQGDALATVLHESLHARVEMDAPDEPNAVRALQSIGLDEGLTELATMEDYDQFVQQAGYEHAEQQDPKYPGAVHATAELLERASSSDADRTELLSKALDQPVAMRWDTIADSIVRNELADAVPSDAAHQQAARAHIVCETADSGWASVNRRDGSGRLVAADTDAALNRAIAEIQTHYAQHPGEPYPARVPNPAAAVSTQLSEHEQQRGAPTQTVDLTKLPAPDAAARVADAHSGPGEAARPNTTQPASTGRTDAAQPAAHTAGQQGDPMRFLNNQAPAAHATRPGPSLGDGSRGAGAPAGPSVNRPTPSRTPTPDRGGRD